MFTLCGVRLPVRLENSRIYFRQLLSFSYLTDDNERTQSVTGNRIGNWHSIVFPPIISLNYFVFWKPFLC